MSIKIQTTCWSIKLPPTTKIVLVCLADFADDYGRCYPSAQLIAERTGLNERSVRRAIASLENDGHLSRSFCTGKRTDYIIHPCQKLPDPCRSVTPATVSPLTENTEPLTHSTIPMTEDTKTPDRGVNITITNHQEPSVTISKDICVAVAPTPKISKGTRLPVDWQLPKELGNFALEQGLSRDMVIREAEKFRDHWIAQSGQKGVKADWPATWRNWIRRNAEKSVNKKTFYELTQEAKERDADKRLTGLASCDMATLEALGLAKDGKIKGARGGN